mmetsp:Transcript_21053/g.31465  ORF Transcript_21053/g.31465 Transcript_21053/m.31465 type:complete len:81 (+) Transcript_21053:705-947(+)
MPVAELWKAVACCCVQQLPLHFAHWPNEFRCTAFLLAMFLVFCLDHPSDHMNASSWSALAGNYVHKHDERQCFKHAIFDE